jgi:SIR2-like domain/CHAT domain
MSTKRRKRSSASLDTPELAALTNYIRERKCVLFVGAGLSLSAGLPDWGSLMRTVVDTTTGAAPEAAKELDALFDRGKYIELADQCRELLGPAYFHKLLRQILGRNVQPTELHRAIVETPYACIVTTNFDTLLEDAYARHSGRGLPRTPMGTELANQGTLLLDGAFFILKAHGTLQHDQSMVFTADDYRRITYDNPAFQSFLSALLLSHAVLFVGYSLSDPNFRLLLDSQLTTFDGEVPSRYAVMSGVGPVERDLMWRTARIRVLSYEAGRHEYVGQVLRTLADRSAVDAMGTRRSPEVRTTIGMPDELPTYQLAIRGRGGQFDFGFRNGTSAEPLSARGDGDDEWWATEAAVLDWTRLVESLPASYSATTATREGTNAIGLILAQVVPQRVREWLTRIPDNAVLSLDLTPDAEIFPWEWTQIEHEPISQRVALVRRPPGISSTARGRPFAGKPLRALVVGDPSAKSKEEPIPLPGALEEARQVARVLRRSKATVRLLVQHEASYARVMHELRNGWYDVVHFAGHAWFDASESYIALHDGRVRASELVSAFNRHPPSLVMLNSHYTTHLPVFTDASDVPYPPEPTIGDTLQLLASKRRGFTQLAARSGVGAFIGCIGNPGDESAMRFAVQLYSHMMQGMAVGHAVRAARQALASTSQDQTYLYYTVNGYGDLVLSAPVRPGRPRGSARHKIK